MFGNEEKISFTGKTIIQDKFEKRINSKANLSYFLNLKCTRYLYPHEFYINLNAVKKYILLDYNRCDGVLFYLFFFYFLRFHKKKKKSEKMRSNFIYLVVY